MTAEGEEGGPAGRIGVCLVCTPAGALLSILTHPWHISQVASFALASRPIPQYAHISLGLPLPVFSELEVSTSIQVLLDKIPFISVGS